MKSIPGDIPQYLLIKAQLQARIQSGALKSGDKLPSERELCAIFNTTRITIRESLAQLESSGLIWRADRRGWFVTPERLWLDPTQNTNFHKLCREQGREPKTALLSGVLTTVPVEVMEPLQLQPFDQIYLLTRLRYADGRAVCYCENHCLPARVPELLRQPDRGIRVALQPRLYQHASVVLPHRHACAGRTCAGSYGRTPGAVAAPSELRSTRASAGSGYRILASRQPAH